MRHTLTLLATLLVALAVAPAADAKWMTGNQNPPIYTDDDACRNGMFWTYATVAPGLLMPPALPLQFHTVRIINAPTVAGPQTLTVPWRPIAVPGVLSTISVFHYSGRLRIDFRTSVAPGHELRMRWLDPNGLVLNSAASHRVRDCYVGVRRSLREVAVMTDDWKLAIGVLQPRRWYHIEGGIVIVTEQAADGDVVLEPPVE